MTNPISKLSKIETLRPQDLNCNIFSVYDYDGMTIQELLCQFFEKINQCVDISNATFKLAEWLVNEGLEQEVVKKLELWLSDGTLATIINETIFNELNTKVDKNTDNINKIVVADNSNFNSLQEAHDHVVSKGGGVLNISKNESLTSQFNWDVRKVIIQGNGHTIDFNLPNKIDYAIQTISSETFSQPYYQATNGISRLRIRFNRGNGFKLSGVSTGKACSHITFDKCAIYDADLALKFGDNAYLVQFRDCDIFDTNQIMDLTDPINNSGENINFIGCALYNSLGGFKLKSGASSVFFTHCSFDYFEKGSVFDIDNSKVFVENCHFEFTTHKFDDGVVPIVCKGDSGTLSINNSLMLLTSHENPKIPSVFHTEGEQTRINLTSSFLYGLKCTSGWLCGGTGKLITDKNVLNVVPECTLKISPSTTQSATGSMTIDKIADFILTEDTSPITENLIGGNIKVSLVNDDKAYKYGKSVKIEKVGGGGTVGAFAHFAPIERGSTNNFELVMKRISGSGNINITYGYCTVNGLNFAKEEKGVITKEISVSSWDKTEAFIKQAPLWATHMYINIATSSFSSGEMRIGEITVNSF